MNNRGMGRQRSFERNSREPDGSFCLFGFGFGTTPMMLRAFRLRALHSAIAPGCAPGHRDAED